MLLDDSCTDQDCQTDVGSRHQATDALTGHIDASLVSTDAQKFNVAFLSKSDILVCGDELMACFDGTTNQTGVFQVMYAWQQMH